MAARGGARARSQELSKLVDKRDISTAVFSKGKLASHVERVGAPERVARREPDVVAFLGVRARHAAAGMKRDAGGEPRSGPGAGQVLRCFIVVSLHGCLLGVKPLCRELGLDAWPIGEHDAGTVG